MSILLRDSPVQINWIIGSFHFHKLLFFVFVFFLQLLEICMHIFEL